MGSCWQCPYFVYDAIGYDPFGEEEMAYSCRHPDRTEQFLVRDAEMDEFLETYPNGFPDDCPVDDVEE